MFTITQLKMAAKIYCACNNSECEGICREKNLYRVRNATRPQIAFNVCPASYPWFRKIERDKFNNMLDEFYAHHGWDEKGIPTPETLERLGLEKEPSHLL